MRTDIYLNGVTVQIGDKVSLNDLMVTITEDFLRDNSRWFTFKQKKEYEDTNLDALLIKFNEEVERRGFVQGAKFYSLNSITKKPGNNICTVDNNFHYNEKSNLISTGNGIIYCDGVWTDIFDEKKENDVFHPDFDWK